VQRFGSAELFRPRLYPYPFILQVRAYEHTKIAPENTASPLLLATSAVFQQKLSIEFISMLEIPMLSSARLAQQVVEE
jgi:hypothetical protein